MAKKRKTLIERLAEMLNEDPDVIATIDSFDDSDDQWIEINPSEKDYNNGHHITHIVSFHKNGARLKDIKSFKTKYDIHEDSELIK